MNNKDFARQLEKRTRRFTIWVIRMSSGLPNTPEGRVVRYQISKSSSSIGANYREANRARSRADFKNKIGICEGEASETIYWLEIIIESGLKNDDEMTNLFLEAKEILAIFTSIGKNTSL